MKAELYIQCRCINGEGPVWDAAHQCLRFIDVFGNCIHTWENGRLSTVDVGENIGCAVPRAGGGMVAGLLSGWYAVDLDSGEKKFLCNPEPNPATRCNDGKADPLGNLWIGNMSRSLDSGAGEAQPESGLYCMDPQGQVKTMLTGLATVWPGARTAGHSITSIPCFTMCRCLTLIRIREAFPTDGRRSPSRRSWDCRTA